MRISSIQNYYRTNYTSQNVQREKTNVVPKFINNQSFTTAPLNSVRQSVPVNFMGIQKNALQVVKQISLDDKLASAFRVASFGDVVVTGKDLKTAQKAIKAAIPSIDDLIKKMFFVQEDNMEGAGVFFRNSVDALEFINPNKFDVNVVDTMGKSPLKTGESYFLAPDDAVQIKDKKITINDDFDSDLDGVFESFVTKFDFSDKVDDVVKKQNMKTALLMTQTKRTKGRELSFADVGGQDEVINQLKKGILYPVKYPEAFSDAKLNHGFIMYGPPGTGKTLIAEALAKETKADFTKLNGLEMESKWVGESEENWRNLFAAAKENQPAIIFIDEFDAVARKRSGSDIYGDKVVNQLLTLMSDVEKNGDDIFVIAATNKVNALDDAITRSGRFGKHIEVKAPNTVDGINKILDIHTKTKKLDADVDKVKLSKKLLDMKATGADVAHIVNEANENSFERLGVYKKMEEGSFTFRDVENMVINNEDFDKAIEAFSASRGKGKPRPIGFNKQEK